VEENETSHILAPASPPPTASSTKRALRAHAAAAQVTASQVDKQALNDEDDSEILQTTLYPAASRALGVRVKSSQPTQDKDSESLGGPVLGLSTPVTGKLALTSSPSLDQALPPSTRVLGATPLPGKKSVSPTPRDAISASLSAQAAAQPHHSSVDPIPMDTGSAPVFTAPAWPATALLHRGDSTRKVRRAEALTLFVERLRARLCVLEISLAHGQGGSLESVRAASLEGRVACCLLLWAHNLLLLKPLSLLFALLPTF
jgi:hypothetical protein